MMILSQENTWVNLDSVVKINAYIGNYQDENGNDTTAYEISAVLTTGEDITLGYYDTEAEVDDIITHQLANCFDANIRIFKMP